MATPTYEVKRVAGRYVAVPQQPTEGLSCAAWLVAGAASALMGWSRGGLGGTILVIGGGLGLYRGVTGRNPLAGMFCCPKRARDGDPHQTPSFQHDESAKHVSQLPSDDVDEAVMESFPASDASAHTVSVGL